jgi:hypothetical protein
MEKRGLQLIGTIQAREERRCNYPLVYLLDLRRRTMKIAMKDWASKSCLFQTITARFKTKMK